MNIGGNGGGRELFVCEEKVVAGGGWLTVLRAWFDGYQPSVGERGERFKIIQTQTDY